MPDRLWTNRDSEDLTDWRPERPEPPRQRAQRKPLPERAPVPMSEAPTEAIDVAGAAERVRGLRREEPTQVSPPKKAKGTPAPAVAAPQGGPVDVPAAAERIRSRQAANTNGTANGGSGSAPPAGGSPFGARSRPAPPVAGPPT